MATNEIIKDNIRHLPQGFQVLVNEALEEYINAFSNNLSALYITGSWTRNEMRDYSDADFIGVLVSKPDQDQITYFNSSVASLTKKWSKKGVSQVDAKLIVLQENKNYLTILRRSVIEHDGILVYGSELKKGVYEEFSKKHIASCFIQLFLEFICNLNLHTDKYSLETKKARRITAKLIIRTMEWLAVVRGAKVTGRMDDCPEDIQKFAPELNEDLAFCWPLYESGKISDKDLNKLLECFCNSLDLLEKEGVIVNKELLEAVINKIKNNNL